MPCPEVKDLKTIHGRYGERRNYRQTFRGPQIPKPLPPGVIGGAMWSVGIALAMLFFVLRGANHLWVLTGRPFARNAVCSTDPLVLRAWIRCSVDPMASHSLVSAQSGPLARGCSIQDASDAKGAFDSFRVMKWLSISVVGPIAVLTLGVPETPDTEFARPSVSSGWGFVITRHCRHAFRLGVPLTLPQPKPAPGLTIG